VTNLIILTDNDSSGRESKIEIKRKLGRMFKLHFPKMVSKDIGAVSADKIRSTILPAVKGYY
jgi:5S rRNA maturation endonuclease (ribonuclease M5)